MQITVDLQDMFSYSLTPAILTTALAFIFWFIASLLKKDKKKDKKKETKKQEKVKPLKKTPPKDIVSIKAAYIRSLTDIAKKHSVNELTDRAAYQKLSLTIRQFVFEVTGIQVHNYTLEEIKNAGIPKLYELIEECYAPEFAPENDSNITDSINKARKVIEEWN